MRDKIAEILFEARYYLITEKVVDIITDKILFLFDISKVEVEETIPIQSKNGYSKRIRPATWDDIKKGGILRVKE